LLNYGKTVYNTGMDEDLKIIVDDPEYKIWGTKIEGLLVFQRKLFADDRGFFQEFARTPAIEKVLGRPLTIKQWSLSYSLPGVLRGIHAESQDKVITLSSGKIFSAISDLRPESPTFGQVVTFELDMSNSQTERKTLIVSKGLGNSFLVLGDQPAQYFYAISEIYAGSDGKKAVRWNDPDLNIKWPEEPKIMSEDDKNVHPFLRDLFPDKFK